MIEFESIQQPTHVAISILVAILTAFVAMETASRIPEHSGARRFVWVVISAICLGGGIWSMHFIAMLGFLLPIPVDYDPALTLLSLVLPIVVAGLGFHFMFTGDGSMTKTKTKILVLGIVYGIAIVTMHYIGMAAMEMQAYIEWDYVYVVLSVVVAIAAATASIGATSVGLSVVPAIASSVLMGAAISGMHYIAMCAVSVIKNPDVVGPIASGYKLGNQSLGIWVMAVSITILFTGLLFSIYDREK